MTQLFQDRVVVGGLQQPKAQAVQKSGRASECYWGSCVDYAEVRRHDIQRTFCVYY